MIHWEWLPFGQLDAHSLYAVMGAREAVFVVEQNCVYRDADGLDPSAWHLIGWTRDTEVAAYLRVLPAGAKFAEHSIGRVLTTAAFRGHGLGREVMLRGLARLEDTFGRVPVRISAQAHLSGFYASLGFAVAGETYLEDGIAHVDMLRAP